MIFNNKTVIITGGSEGVGAAAARMFAEAGANLMLVARGKKNLDALAEELRDKTSVEVFAMDVSDANACVDLFKKAQFEFGRIDVLVNNAGYHKRGNVETVEAEDLGKMIDVNLKAPIMLTRIALPYIREAGGGAIVNVGSLAGRLPVPGSTAYAASKAGMVGFSKSLAREIGSRGITVNIVAPGFIDTDMTKILPEEQRAGMLAQVPLGRLGEGQDIANAVLFLASAGGAYITGETLHVNGGMAMV